MPATNSPPTTALSPEVEADLAAFNAAFDALDLDWHWDAKAYLNLPHDDDRAAVSAYLRDHRPHLLKSYDLAFLCDAILDAKHRYRARSRGGPA